MKININDNLTLEQLRISLRNALTPKYGEREATAMARMIIMSLKGWDMAHLLANGNREASEFIKARAQEILGNLLDDMPLQYALGEAGFYGLKLKVGPGVLIPRPETEGLVEIIVKENRADDLHVLDLCTGSGAIALALARNLSFPVIEAVDISPDAIAVASYNASHLKIKIKISEADIFNYSFPKDSYDIIVSNPPYVDESEKASMEANVLDYEPAIALFVPDDNPLVYYKRIAEIGLSSIKQGGRLYLEINPRHAKELKQLLTDTGFSDVEILLDSFGKQRYIRATRP